MEQSAEEFFHEFRQELLAGAEVNGSFQLAEFVEAVARELVETGFVEGFELCNYRTPRGLRVDGYWFNDEYGLDLFVADFDFRTELESLTATDVTSAFKRVVTFFETCLAKDHYLELEVTSPEYGLARQIVDRKGLIRRINFFLISERSLSGRLQTLEDDKVAGIPASYHVWDISRLQRQRSARGSKEPLDLDIVSLFGAGIPCLPASMNADSYQSYLVVIPANVLADLYGKHGSRLLEQNVRSFLQARAKVNKGIRTTILTEPSMFFAYNNGITATAQDVETSIGADGLQITRIMDLQIVNGGQTTASLYHARNGDKASLDDVFVQMKLSVIDSDESEKIVPKISEYANTQNKVNAADFFSNAPFHIRMQEFSRRVLAPAQQGAQRESKWFYERARGQYADEQSNLTTAQQRQFQAIYPKQQFFSKTDLAKFENCWDDHPRWVSLGAQKNFSRYAERIAKEWEASPDRFNESYFKKAVARAIIFKAAEKIVSNQPWYNGGHRSKILPYALASLNEVCRRKEKAIDFAGVWNRQAVGADLSEAIAVAAKFANDDLMNPPPGTSDIGEWSKKDACWTRVRSRIQELELELPPSFYDQLVSLEDQKVEEKTAKKVQKVDNGINVQTRVFEIGAETWAKILVSPAMRRKLSPKEVGVLQVAEKMPARIPTERQCGVLIEILEKAQAEGVIPA